MDHRGVWGQPGVVAALRQLAQDRPGDEAIRFAGSAGTESLSFQTLWDQIRSCASQLRSVALPGDRVVLALPTGPDFVIGFIGSLAAGLVAVPAFPPEGGNAHHHSRLSGIIDDCSPAVVLADADGIEAVTATVGAGRPCRVMAVDRQGAADDAGLHPVTSDMLAFLQYTSGSTSTPKGVMVTHGNLEANHRAIVHALGISDADRCVCWLPLYHDMGLIGGLLLFLRYGLPLLMMSPKDFLASPVSWLQAVSQFRATISTGPNFAFQLCLDRISEIRMQGLDLSSWRHACCGAEPIRAATMRAFTDRFSRVGLGATALYPCYGLAEATLFVTGAVQGAGAREMSFSPANLAAGKAEPEEGGTRLIDCGVGAPGHHVAVVDPATGVQLDEGRVGEVWVSGPSIAKGYWQGDDRVQAVFRARIAGGDDRTYLRTGDLGFFHQGRLFPAGRVKDLIILRGQNVYPQDVEVIIERGVDSIRSGRVIAFAHRDGEVEGIGIAVEISRPTIRAGQFDEIFRGINAVLAASFQEAADLIALLQPGDLPRTSSGKLRRSSCAAMLASGELQPAAMFRRGQDRSTEAGRPETGAERSLAAIWMSVLGLSGVGVDDNFFEMGGQSVAAIHLVARIAEAFGVTIDARFAFMHDTIRAQAAALAALPAASAEELAAEADETALPPLSPEQEGLFAAWQLDPNDAAYRLSAVLRIDGEIRADLLRDAVEDLVLRHAVLRTRIGDSSGILHQIVDTAPRFDWQAEDLTVSGQDLAAALARAENRPFDLAAGPVLRASLFSCGRQTHALLLAVHHIALDGTSAAVLLSELLAIYAARIADREPGLAVPALRYADFARQRVRQVRSDALAAQRAYWREQLDPPAPELALPVDRIRQGHRSSAGGRVDRALDPALVQRLRRAASAHQTTPFVLLLAAWQALLHRYSGQDDIRIGVPVDGRTRSDLQSLVGMAVNTVVIRSDRDTALSVADFIRQTHRRVVEARRNSDVPFRHLVAELQPDRDLSTTPLFRVLFNLEPDWRGALPAVDGLRIEVLEGANDGAEFDLALNVGELDGGLRLSLVYATDIFDAATVERLCGHTVEVLEQLSAEDDRRLGALDLSGDGVVPVARTYDFRPVPARVLEQCLVKPAAEAVVCEDQRLSYGGLADLSGRVAWALQRLGVGADARVGLCVERSVGMVASLLGVLRSGGAYVPLDPSHPEARLREMIGDAGLHCIVVDRGSAERLSGLLADQRLVVLEDLVPEAEPFVDAVPQPLQLAYVIYTSGSTGKPKGVAVSHGSLHLHLEDFLGTYGISAEDTVLHSSTINFDVALHEILPALIRGGRVVMRGPAPWELDRMNAALVGEGVTFARIPTAYWQQWMRSLPPALPKLRQVTVGGEGLPGDALGRWQRTHLAHVRLDNLYGPTETTVASLYHRTGPSDASETIVPIGRPYPGRSAMVLDGDGAVVPAGGLGELCVGGDSVARGYLNRPGLTAERFVPDPHGAPGSRLYRSGDLCRMRSDGTVLFLGRLDQQVKLRGYRIELGEIEAGLRGCAGVKEAAVALKGAGEGKRLVGYVTGDVDPEAIRSALGKDLPEHMIPSAIMVLERLPLTPNGKLDRNALPEPAITASAITAPRTETERILCAVWAEVLSLPAVGITDNFFRIGGDSILSLRVIARAREQGIRVTPRQVFEHPTVERLAQVAEAVGSDEAVQAEITDRALALTPIQSWFFERYPEGLSHWNQSVLLRVKGELSEPALQGVLSWLVRRHDALRLRFDRTDGAWRQRVVSTEDASLLQVTTLTGEAWQSDLEAFGQSVQTSLDLGTGPLLRVGYARLPEQGEGRLLLAIHHLAVDGVSWRVLLSDLQRGYERALAGEAQPAGGPRTPWSHWAQALQAYGTSPEVQSESAWWREALSDATGRLPVRSGGDRRLGSSREVTWRLEASQTRRLLQEVPAAYRTGVEDVLLTALSRVLADWSGAPGVLVDLEGHGREGVVPDVDVSETVGWFTIRYPVWLAAETDAAAHLIAVKERLRSVPHRGLHWGLLPAASREGLPRSEVSFNYLGRFDGSLAEDGLFGFASESGGPALSPDAVMGHALDINGMVTGDSLSLSWRYSPEAVSAAEIEALVAQFDRELRSLIAHCLAQAPGATASDFPLSGLTQAQFQALDLDVSAIQDLYPATAVQQGMLFHSLMRPGEGVYVNQLRVTLKGSPDRAALRGAWDAVVSRHDILRTGFEWRHGGEALQMVHHQVRLPYAEHDWHAVKDYDFRLAEWRRADLAQGFDPSSTPLLRIAVFARPDGDCDLIRTMHHALTDGWSTSQLLGEVGAAYEALRRGAPVPSVAGPSYRDYVSWLARQGSGEAWWRDQLAEVDEPAGLVESLEGPAAGEAGAHRVDERLSADLSERLRQAAQRHAVTLNTLMQGAWSVLLWRYSNRPQVVFGTTVSGRPPELAGSDRMLGLFINSLPVWVNLSPGEQVSDWLRGLQDRNSALRQYEHTPLPSVQRWAGQVGESLFDSLVVFENYPVDAAARAAQGALAPRHAEVVERTDTPLTLVVVPGAGLELTWSWDGALVSSASVAGLRRHYVEVLEQLASQGELRLGDLVLSGGEAAPVRQHYAFRSVTGRVLEQCRRDPDAEAVIHENDRLSYRDLEELSGRMAWALARVGVGADVRVGLCMERSTGLVASLLGILRAGGAYVPLDPAYPEARLRDTIADAGLHCIVADRASAARLSGLLDGQRLVVLEDLAEGGGRFPDAVPHPLQLAYVIYTSGSTGRPKGVAISHEAVARLLDSTEGWFGFGPSDVWTLFHSYAFDFSVWEIFGALAYGGRLVVVPHWTARDVQALHDLLRAEAVTVLNQTPSAFQPLLHLDAASDQPLTALRAVIFGGEKLEPATLAPWVAKRGDVAPALINMYGITETTVHATYRRLAAADVLGPQARSVIGESLPDLPVHVLDQTLQLAPANGMGELYVGGAGLARGYLNRPGLTAERFVPNPYGEPGSRLYRSGDLARSLASGEPEYIGRLDQQVKLRGYRIELGEIEAGLRGCLGVKEAAVALRGSGESKRLVGYVTGDVDPEAIRSALARDLPEHMIPSAIVVLERLPLTPNGKLDRNALPEQEITASVIEVPRTETERILCAVWAEVLSLPAVGITDNFFRIGGDSILSLRVIARAREQGIRVTPRQVFEHPTVERLAQVAEAVGSDEAAQAEITDHALALTPIQSWFFERYPEGLSHWNQSVLLRVKGELSEPALEGVLSWLVRRHDALRLRFDRTDGTWQQRVAVSEDTPLLRVTTLTGEAWQADLEAFGQSVQTSLDLDSGPLLRVGYARLPEQGEGRLLLAIHHLAVDGVSWRVLLSDLQRGYERALAGEAQPAGGPRTPWSHWAQALQAYGATPEVQSESAWWRASLSDATGRLPVRPGGDRRLGSSREVTWRLEASQTRRLLQEVPQAYRTGVEDVLLAALSRVLADWSGAPGVLVDLEGHGREGVVPDVDVSETVGWFTTRYPVWLQSETDAAAHLIGVKERLRSVPHRGLHWGLLPAAARTGLPRSEVSFNYLGRFDGSLAEDGLFSFTSGARESSVSPEAKLGHTLDINAKLFSDELELSWRYSPDEVSAAEVEALVAQFDRELRALIAHCLAQAPGATASDFPLSGLTQAQFQALDLDVSAIQDLYPATAVQQGMFLHGELQPGEGVYVNQLRVTFAQAVQPAAFRGAWQAAVSRHDILRTGFEWSPDGHALQVVRHAADLPFERHDWSEDADYEGRLSAWREADLARDFDPAAAPLMRVALFIRPDGGTDLVWTHHHALMDGWSTARLLAGVVEDYGLLLAGDAVAPRRSPAYRDYLAWVARQPENEAWWRRHLQDADEAVGLTAILPPVQGNASDATPREIRHRLDEGLSRRLHEAAQRHQVTLYTLVQAAWAILLGKHGHSRHAAFGVTVAGRPADLPGVQEMLGLFINSLPFVTDIPAAGPVGDWLAALQARQAEMRQHEHTPLAKIQNWAGRPGQPLFDSLVVFENYPIDETAMRGGQLDAQGFQAASRTHYPLTLIVLPGGRDRPQVELKFSWDPTRLDSDGVGRLVQTYVDLLADLADAAPDLPVGLIGRAPTPTPAPAPAVAEAPRPLPELLPVRLAARGMGVTARPALVSRGQSLSWADLWRRSGALAGTLQAQGVTPDSRVALLLPRGIPFVIGLLAAWRAGAAYVPLDPAQPAERLAWQLADCGAGWLVAEGPVDWCPPNVAQLLPGEAAAATAVQAPVVLHPDQAAYVIYTSGSTGRPKGVVVSHGSLAAYVSSVLDQMPSGIASAALLSTVAADLGHTTLFGALWQGWTLHLLDDLEAFDGARLGAYLRQHAVDLLKLVPSHLGALLHTPDAASVLPRRCLVLGGEAIGGPLADQIRSLRPDLAVLNHYGPTETTVGVVTRQGLGSLSPVPLGRALPHAQIHVLDPNGHALAAEVAGEIAIGGQGVARGYLARPGLTAERFVPDPYGRPGSRLYRSGDRGRCSADGELVFLGRLDAQVKIRGWRVEPGEVAEQIRALPAVTDAAVVVRDSGTGPRLVGYVTGDVDPEAVRAALARRLPDPMIPSAIMVLERLPVTPNGKLDRAALPEPATASATVVVPRTDTERMLCAVWMELLALPAVGVTDDFFRIGGDSLIAMRVMVRLRQSFGPDLPLRLLFDHPVLEALAAQLEATARLAADDIAELQDILEELAS